MFNTLTKLIMDEQEVLNQIKELQKQRTSLKKQDAVLVSKIMALRDKLWLYNIKKGYYTDNYCLFCRVYDTKGDSVLVYELDSAEPYLTKEIYSRAHFKETYYRECTKEEYDNALDKVVKYFKE